MALAVIERPPVTIVTSPVFLEADAAHLAPGGAGRSR